MLDLGITNPAEALGVNGALIAPAEQREPAAMPRRAVGAINHAARNIFEDINRAIEPLQKFIVFKHLLQIVYAPVKVFEIFRNFGSFSRKDHQKNIDTGLDTCNKVRELGESISTFIVALETVKAIPAVLVAATVPFTAVLTVLSLSSIIIKIRLCIRTHRFFKEIEKAGEEGKVNGKVTLASYENILKLIEKKNAEDRSFVGEMFNTTDDKLADLLVRIQLSVKDKLSWGNVEEVRKGQKQLENTISSLKGRVRQNIIEASVSIVASVVNIIGTSLLLALPLLPFGWGFLALGVIADTGRFIYHKIGEYQFAQDVGLKRSKWEWLTC